MTNIGTTNVHSRTLTAFYDTREAAQRATDELVAIGIPKEHIRLTSGDSTGHAAVAEDKGFWDELKDIFMPDEDRAGYAEGLRRGGYLLSVQVEEAYYTRAMDILDTDGAVDMDERETTWRSSGWTGYQADAVGMRSTAAVTEGSQAAGLTASTAASTRTAGSTAPVDTLQTGRDEVISLYEETAQVAKRDVNHGRVRLRSYVVETPISQQVNLRNESVQIERRPVDRAISATDAVFQDRVIEAEEHTEEAFITKEARVKEEISLRKTVENQAQTITDTVRRTEVEIEDDRTGRAVGNTVGLVGAFDTTSVVAHMDVIASDGVKIGTVDHMDGPDRIKLARNTSPDGQHHYVPVAWIDHVDTHVHLTKTSSDAKASW